MANKPVGWEKVWEIYPLKNLWKGANKPLWLLAATIIVYLFKGDVYEMHLIKLVCGIVTSGFPSIIGFILTGYALIIGFSGSDFLLKMAKSKADDKHSLFERVNSTFAFVIGVLVVTYIVAACASFIIGLEIKWPFTKGVEFYNNGILFLLLFLFYYSVCALLDIVLNVFNLGQLAHAMAKNKLKTMEMMAKQDVNDTMEVKEKKSFFSRMMHCLLDMIEE